MNRRMFLACGAAALLRGEARPVRITVDTRRKLGRIPADFTGLGFEISSVSTPRLLNAENRQYVQLVRTLGSAGLIRIGGNTSDDASFERQGKALSAPKGSVVNAGNLRQLGAFLDATGWKLIWGLNLGSGDERQAVAEAQAVSAAAKQKLLAFEIGNEPDLFGRGTAHRPNSYSYGDYLQEYRRYKSAIRAELPEAPFAGPDVAGATDWVGRFAAEEGRDLRLLTHHYYRECAHPDSTLDKLLNPDPKLGPQLDKLKTAATISRVPYRICETNSFCGGGKPGVSDTFGAALWVLDFMFTLAQADCGGVNMETGVNQLGFISSYSPIADDEQGNYSPAPEYYGMLAFAQASSGERIAVDLDSAGLNVSSYAVVNAGALLLTIVNKDKSAHADCSVAVSDGMGDGRVLRLTGPSLASKEGVTLGGAAVTADGNWTPTNLERVRAVGGKAEVTVAAGSAAVLSFHRR